MKQEELENIKDVLLMMFAFICLAGISFLAGYMTCLRLGNWMGIP